MRTRSGVGFACGLLGSLAAAPALGAPLDLANPTSRPVRVEFETSSNPSTIGQVYSRKYAATYSASGNVGSVVVTGPVYETAVQTNALDYFNTSLIGALVPGSSTQFRVDIDLTTHQAVAQTLTYQAIVQIPSTQQGTLTRQLSTTATAGYAFLPQAPGFPFFCTPCIPVAGAPYVPVTGKLNAVGSDHFVSADVNQTSFSRAGDLRLSEAPTAPAAPALSGPGIAAVAAGLASLGWLVLRRRGVRG